MPIMCVKRYQEAFLEIDLGLGSSFNIGQIQVNSILRGHWGKKLEEKTGLTSLVSFGNNLILEKRSVYANNNKNYRYQWNTS